jgi:hypothetical protein
MDPTVPVPVPQHWRSEFFFFIVIYGNQFTVCQVALKGLLNVFGNQYVGTVCERSYSSIFCFIGLVRMFL